MLKKMVSSREDPMGLRVKICGIMQPEQGKAIAALGANSIGFICVEASPRYVTPAQIRACAEVLPPDCDRVGVFMDASVETIVSTIQISGLTAVQLHGGESVEFCQALRSALQDSNLDSNLANIELIKAFRVKSAETLSLTQSYECCVDWLLLDAYHPSMGGGTGLTLDWRSLEQFKSDRPWLLAGGLTPDNVVQALETIAPQGIDLSSGVEISPGNKDLDKVARLFENL
jgi:phosphoribosylanthranilate isomerase